jgi:catechol 2,3-dioxygenase-like lactoylglutathione lyase family enzyme
MQPSRIHRVGLPVAAHARAVEAGGRSVWTPRDTPEPGLRIAFVADPDGNLVELLSRNGDAPPASEAAPAP